MDKRDITFQDKLNDLRLDISHPNSQEKVFILVEGESDIRLFRKFFDEDKCKVERIPGGNIRVEEAIEKLLKKKSLLLGIRDADFIHLEATPYSKQNLFLTDFHDIEMTLIAENEVFSSILFEFTSIPITEHSNTRNAIFQFIQAISLLKWLNVKENLELQFVGAGFQDLMSFSDNTLDFKAYFSRVLSKSPKAKISDFDVICEKISFLEKEEFHPFLLCNGHDFLKAFSQFIRKKGNGKSIDDAVLVSFFRTNFSHQHFSKTNRHLS